jgi:PAS domain S-box-containing protein
MRQKLSRPERAASSSLDLGMLAQSAVVAVVCTTPDGRIAATNARFNSMVGAAAASDLLGRHVGDFIAEPAEAGWQRAAADGSTVMLRWRAAAGETVAMRGEVRPVEQPTGRISCGIFVDVSEEQQLRGALQQSARMEALGSLTTGIAHDFNNLLTVLVGNLYLVAEELRDRPKLFERLKSARDAAKRGAELIKQLLAFARREQVEAEAVDAAQVIAELAPLLRRALGVRIELTTDFDPDAAPITANRAQLESVIVNLAVNARDAIPNKGKIAVAVAPAAERETARGGAARTAITVSDDGIGMPDDVVDRVFEPFFSTKRDRGGTGLGLSMVRWFAEQANGSAHIASRVGQGTTVTLLLPAAASAPPARGDMTMPLSTLRGGSERVLVLAADEDVRTTIRQILEVLGYTVHFALAAPETVDLLRAEEYQLVVIDGVERDDPVVLADVRAARPDVKLLTTVDSQSQGERRAAGTGAAVLVKPFSLAELAAAVRRALDD